MKPAVRQSLAVISGVVAFCVLAVPALGVGDNGKNLDATLVGLVFICPFAAGFVTGIVSGRNQPVLGVLASSIVGLVVAVFAAAFMISIVSSLSPEGLGIVFFMIVMAVILGWVGYKIGFALKRAIRGGT